MSVFTSRLFFKPSICSLIGARDYSLAVLSRKHEFNGLCRHKEISALKNLPGCTIILSATLKRLVAIHKRCKDCRITRMDNRLAVVCSSHPRHNQVQQGIGPSKRIHKVYPWRWPDPFDKKYALQRFTEDRYLAAFDS